MACSGYTAVSFFKKYQLEIEYFANASGDMNVKNCTIALTHVKNGTIKTLVRDSLYCKTLTAEFNDMNNDKVKDILINNTVGGRANLTYHLYLLDKINHTIKYVKGFEALRNPSLYPATNIVISATLSGGLQYQFFSINSRNKLINLGHGFEAGVDNDDEKSVPKW